MAALGLGTYGAHVFKPKNPTYKDVWHTASLYHLVHTAALVAAPLATHPHIVCGYIHAIGHQNLAALESYMKDVDEPIHAFSYIRCTLLQLHGKESDAFKSEIMSRIPELVILCRESTFFMVVEHFGGDHNRALCEMDSHPKSLFLYLKTIMEAHTKGSLNFSCFRKGDNGNIPSERRNTYQPNRIEAFLERISEFPKFMRDNPVHVTDKIVEQYLEVKVSLIVSSRWCILYLGERVIFFGGADLVYSHCPSCIGLCQRNSPRMDFDESESLWFRLLDSFYEPLIDSYSTRINSEGKFNTESLARSLDREENNSVHRIRWKLSRFQKGAHILRKLFSLFIKAIVEGMIGYVRLPTIMMKLLSDNGSQEFGDFKLTIL